MTQSVQNMLSKRFDQICFVVEDLQQAMDFFSKTNGVEVWNVAEGLSQTQKEKEYYGQGKGPHHIGFRQKDAAEYAQAEQHYLDLGIAKAMAGFFEGPFGNCRWAYFDTRDQIGCFTELYYVDGELDQRMSELKSGKNVSITD